MGSSAAIESVPLEARVRQREPRGSSLARSFGATRRAADSHSALQQAAKLTAHFPARRGHAPSAASARMDRITEARARACGFVVAAARPSATRAAKATGTTCTQRSTHVSDPART